MNDSYTYIDHDTLALAIDAYEDHNVNRVINKYIAKAEKARTEKSWFRRRNLTLDQSLEKLCERADDQLFSVTPNWDIRQHHDVANQWRRTLRTKMAHMLVRKIHTS